MVKITIKPLTPYHPMFNEGVRRSTPRPAPKPDDAPASEKADAQPERPVDNRNDKKDRA